MLCLTDAGEKDQKKTDNQAQKREDQLAHLNVDVAPASPSPAPNMESSALLTRENSLASVSSLGHISSDTQKFLKFAGKFFVFACVCLCMQLDIDYNYKVFAKVDYLLKQLHNLFFTKMKIVHIGNFLLI